MSSISRRELARRRSARAWGRSHLLALLVLLVVVGVGLVAFYAGRGSL